MATDGGASYRTFRAPGRGGLGIDPRKTALLFIEMQNETRPCQQRRAAHQRRRQTQYWP